MQVVSPSDLHLQSHTFVYLEYELSCQSIENQILVNYVIVVGILNENAFIWEAARCRILGRSARSLGVQLCPVTL